jgi:dipeptidyl aminopeptidase/acylaminoacyl peptidase
MKRLRTTLLWALTISAFWLAVSIPLGIIAVRLSLHPARRALGQVDEASVRETATRNQADLTDAAIPAPDGVSLKGWHLRPHAWNGDTVMLLHGQADNRVGMLGNADLLLRDEFAVLLPDARAHGASGGEVATYGVLEKGDIRAWADWLQKQDSPRCIDGLGESMGGAELLASLDATSRFCAVVAESPFASFREASYYRLGSMFHARGWAGRILTRPAVDAAFLYARWKYEIDLERASPSKAVAVSHSAVLLIHGKRDVNLPPRMSEMIVADNLGRLPRVELWEPAQAGH